MVIIEYRATIQLAVDTSKMADANTNEMTMPVMAVDCKVATNRVRQPHNNRCFSVRTVHLHARPIFGVLHHLQVVWRLFLVPLGHPILQVVVNRSTCKEMMSQQQRAPKNEPLLSGVNRGSVVLTTTDIHNRSPWSNRVRPPSASTSMSSGAFFRSSRASTSAFRRVSLHQCAPHVETIRQRRAAGRCRRRTMAIGSRPSFVCTCAARRRCCRCRRPRPFRSNRQWACAARRSCCDAPENFPVRRTDTALLCRA